jgi:hypothetical protein
MRQKRSQEIIGDIQAETAREVMPCHPKTSPVDCCLFESHHKIIKSRITENIEYGTHESRKGIEYVECQR